MAMVDLMNLKDQVDKEFALARRRARLAGFPENIPSRHLGK